jgi:hypothetical protein
MKRIADPLVSSVNADRLHYSTGELLGAADFRDEQTHHRRQLAQALLHLQGSGHTGLCASSTGTGPAERAPEDEVGSKSNRPRAGSCRTPHRSAARSVCASAMVRVHRREDPEQHRSSTPAICASRGAPTAGWPRRRRRRRYLPFVLRVSRGYTPAFASGPFDALDASQPSRVRDGCELSLVLRTEADGDLPVASDPWAAISGATTADRLAAAEQAAFDCGGSSRRSLRPRMRLAWIRWPCCSRGCEPPASSNEAERRRRGADSRLVGRCLAGRSRARR